MRDPLNSSLQSLRTLSANLATGGPDGPLNSFLQTLPTKLATIGRTASYGSWLNFYQCSIERPHPVAGPGLRPVRRDVHRRCRGATGRAEVPAMKAFGERNPIVLAVAGTAVLALVGLGTFYSADLPVIGGGTDYAANFTDAAGLATGDDVTVAGVKVGTIQSITLAGDQVRVGFRVKDTWIGNTSTAAVKIKTLLGQEYVAIDPEGDGPLASGGVIPTSRTTTPLDVTSALSRLSTTVGAIDTQRLAQSFQTLSAAFADTPATVRSALDGLTALSRTISAKDADLQALAQRANDVTGVVSDSNQRFTALINAGAALLSELQQRSSAITQLLAGTTQLATQLTGLVHDDDAVLGPALQQLSRVTSILTSNNANLDEALRLIGPYYSMLNDAAGSGPWVDIYVCGLFDSSGAPVLDANARRDCNPPTGGGR